LTIETVTVKNGVPLVGKHTYIATGQTV